MCIVQRTVEVASWRQTLIFQLLKTNWILDLAYEQQLLSSQCSLLNFESCWDLGLNVDRIWILCVHNAMCVDTKTCMFTTI